MNPEITKFFKNIQPSLREHHEIFESYLSAIWACPLINFEDGMVLADAYYSTNFPTRVYETSHFDSSVAFCPQLKSLEILLISEIPSIAKIACLLYLMYKSKRCSKNFECLLRLLRDSYDFIHNSIQFWRRRKFICSQEYRDYQTMTNNYISDRLYFKELYKFIKDASKFLQVHLIQLRRLYPLRHFREDMDYEFDKCSIDLTKDDKFVILNMFEELKIMFKNLGSKVLCTIGVGLCTEYSTKDIYQIQTKLNEPIEYMVLHIPPTAFTLHTEYNTVQHPIKKFSGRISECSNQAEELEQYSSSLRSSSPRDPKLDIEILRQQYELKKKFHEMKFETRGFSPLRYDTIPPAKRPATLLTETTTIAWEDQFGTTTMSGHCTTLENKSISKTSSEELDTPLDSPLRHDTLLPEKRAETSLSVISESEDEFYTLPTISEESETETPPDSPRPLPKSESGSNTSAESTQFTALYKILYKWNDLLRNHNPIPLENIDGPRHYNDHIQEEEGAIPSLHYGTRHVMNSYLKHFLANVKTAHEKAQLLHKNVQVLENLETLGPEVTDLSTHFETCQNNLTTFIKVVRNHIEDPINTTPRNEE